jgi:glutathione S-transferase
VPKTFVSISGAAGASRKNSVTIPSTSFFGPHLRHSETRVTPLAAQMASMQLPSEYGWTLVALGGAVMTTMYGGIKVRASPTTRIRTRRVTPIVYSPPPPNTKVNVLTPTLHCVASLCVSQVALARKKFDVKYPTLYAESSHKHAKAFNCVQRAHQQTLEWMAPVMVMTAANGLVFPIAAAQCCAVWTVGKILYINGYSSGDPEKRQVGGLISHLGDLPLIIMTFVAGHKLLTA